MPRHLAIEGQKVTNGKIEAAANVARSVLLKGNSSRQPSLLRRRAFSKRPTDIEQGNTNDTGKNRAGGAVLARRTIMLWLIFSLGAIQQVPEH
jgi:hypothetical protein